LGQRVDKMKSMLETRGKIVGTQEFEVIETLILIIKEAATRNIRIKPLSKTRADEGRVHQPRGQPKQQACLS
jgi:hypothetical protein